MQSISSDGRQTVRPDGYATRWWMKTRPLERPWSIISLFRGQISLAEKRIVGLPMSGSNFSSLHRLMNHALRNFSFPRRACLRVIGKIFHVKIVIYRIMLKELIQGSKQASSRNIKFSSTTLLFSKFTRFKFHFTRVRALRTARSARI